MLRPARGGMAGLLMTLIVIPVCAGLLGWTQFSFEGMLDGDSYFHTRAARELDQHGIRRSFAQTAYSTWRDRYSDKDWLFHAYLIPFQRIALDRPPGDSGEPGTEDLVAPGKWAMIVLSALLFSALALTLRTVGARFPWLWVLLYFTATDFIIWRLLAVRPGFAGVLLLLLEIALIVRGSGILVAVVGALHVYTHSSFFLLPVMAAAMVVARAVRREPLRLSILLGASAGPAVAFLVHPYFPNNVGIAWDQLAGVARHAWFAPTQIPRELFGEELGGISPAEFVQWAPAYLPAVVALVAFLASRRQPVSTMGLGLTLMSGGILVAGLLSYRFMDFFLPVAVLTGARLFAELLGEQSLREAAARRDRTIRTLAVTLLLCLIAGVARRPVLAVRQEMQGQVTEGQRQRPAIMFLRTVADPDDIVYHTFWFDFSTLYHFRPNGRYIEALDPIFFLRCDPRLFSAALALMQGRTTDAYGIIKKDFRARWVYTSRYSNFPAVTAALFADPRFTKVFMDEHGLIFRVE